MNNQGRVSVNKIDSSSQMQYSRQREAFRNDLQNFIREREQRRSMEYSKSTQSKKIG